MILYDKHPQPESISLSHVTQYIETLIEVTEREAERLLAYAQEEIKKHEGRIRGNLHPYYRVGDVPRSPNCQSDFRIKWKYDRDTDTILPESINHGSTGTSLIDWLRYDFKHFNWTRLPHFEIAQGKGYIYPEVRKLESKGRYHVVVRDKGGQRHNERFTASFFYEPEKGIWCADYYLEGNKISFWNFYDKSSDQDRKILLRDWLPIEEEYPL